MRFDVHTIRVHLVNELLQVPHVQEVWHDGSDVVILDLKSGESVCIHLVERYMSVDEISYIYKHDAESNLHTMLLLWGEMFLPSHGQAYVPDDWMRILLSLHNGQIYAYDAFRAAPYIFSVFFDIVDGDYRTRHGKQINIGQLAVDTVHTTFYEFTGFWRVAHFDGDSRNEHTDYWHPDADDPHTTSIRFYYNILGLTLDAEREAIKQAYRTLARKHHPDLSDAPDTTETMQRINDAYARVIAYVDQTPGED